MATSFLFSFLLAFPFLLLLASPNTQAFDLSECTLKLVQIVFRHGDRSAIHGVPALGDEAAVWPDGLGQLTTIGMRQHYDLGQYFHRRYFEDLKFLDGYHPEQVYVRSTDMDRTLMSAASQLASFFPPTENIYTSGDGSPVPWRPVPIHTVPFQHDELLVPDDSRQCPRFDKLRTLHHESAEWKAKDQEPAPSLACQGVGLSPVCSNDEFLDAVAQRVELDEAYTLDDVYKVFDTIFCRTRHNISVPSWIDPNVNSMSASTFSHLQSLNDWSMFEEFNGVEERRLTGGQLVKQMLSVIDSVTSNTSAIKLYLYSAHDTTVAPFLEALNTDHWRLSAPPYACAVIVELYESNNGSHYVQILFRNETGKDAHVLNVPGCGGEGVCDLSTLVAHVGGVVPQDWVQECSFQWCPTSID